MVLTTRHGVVLRILCCAVLLGLVLRGPLAPTVTHAQILRGLQGAFSGRLIEPPRSVRQQLEDAEEAIAAERYSDAVLALGPLLSGEANEEGFAEEAGQDYFLDVDENPQAMRVARESLMRRAEDLLGQMPAAGLEVYQLKYGPLAEKSLEQATASQDWRGIQEVVRKYFHTDAGYRATYLWAYHELSEGQPLAAARLLTRLARQPQAAQRFGGQLDVALATARRLAGRGTDEVIDALRPAASDGRLPPRSDQYRIGDQAIAAPAVGGEAAWLVEQLAPLERRRALPRAEYRLFGGSPDRNDLGRGEMPLSRVRWKQPTAPNFPQSQEISEAVEAMTAVGELPPPTWTPLIVGDQVITRTTDYLMAIDFATGKQIWNDVVGATLEFSEDRDNVTELPNAEDRDSLLKQRIWNDVPYGRISSDGERVFLLDGLEQLEMANFNQFGGLRFRGTRPADTTSNTLKALELSTEGKLLWKVGAEELDPTPLTEAFFLGPPLPLDGRLYVIAELAGDIILLCLDPSDGAELWRQQLLAIEAGSIDMDPVRRVAGAMPAYQDGILVCPTGNGAVVAIDLASRRLLWAATYRRNDAIDSSLQSRRAGFDPDKLMQRWLDGTPLIVDGRVFITPIESERLYALDLLTGERLFPEIQRVRMRYLAGVADEKCILVGSRQVRAHDVATGRAVWTMQLPAGDEEELISGRGYLSNERFYLPTTDSRILAVDLKDGSVVDEQKTDFELGNLLFVNGHLISQGPTEIAVAYGQQSLAPLVQRGLEQTPNDPDVLVNQAALLLEQGERAAAIETLRNAREIAPDHEGARFLAVFAMLDSLREDFQANSAFIEPLKQWIALRPQEIELHTLLARGELERERPLAALDSLITLSRLAVSETMMPSDRGSANNLQSGSSRPSIDSWLAARTRQTLDQVPADQQAEVDARIATHLGPFENRSTGSQLRVLKHFEAAKASDPLRQRLIRRLAAEGALQSAERLARSGLRLASGDEQAARYRLHLAELYAEAGFLADASAQRKQAEALAPEMTPAESLTRLLPDSTSLAAPDWPPYVASEWNTPRQRIGFSRNSPKRLEVIARRGEHLADWQVVREGDAYSLRDPRGRSMVIPLDSSSRDDSGSRQVIFDGGLMIVLTPTEIFALDLFAATSERSEAVLWRKNWRQELGGRVATSSSDAPPFGKPRLTYQITNTITPDGTGELRLGPVVGDSLFVLISGELQAIDVRTGTVRWRNPTAPRSGHVVSDGERVAVTSPSDRGREIVFFAVDDGRRLEQRGWPDQEEIWFATDRHVLTYRKSQGNPTALRLRDVFSGEVLLERRFGDETEEETEPTAASGDHRIKGCLEEGRWMTLLESDGQLTIWNLVTAEVLTARQVDPIDELNGIEVVRRRDQLIVLPETQVKPPREPNSLPIQHSHGDTHHRVDGPVMAISLDTGEPLWEHRFEDGPWGITVSQASASPLLLFSRARSIISPISPTRRTRELSLLALDTRDGRVADLAEELVLPSERQDPETELEIDPQAKTVTARIGPAAMVYSFLETPPPTPPASEDDEADKETATEKPTEEPEEAEEPFELFR